MTFPKALFLVPFLAACGGGTTVELNEETIDQQPPVQVRPATAAELETLHYSIYDPAYAAGTRATFVVPSSGTATYRGAAEYYDELRVPEVYSAVTMTANFSNSSMTGVLDNFVVYGDEIAMPGSVRLTNGMIYSSLDGMQYGGELEGGLGIDGESFAVNGNVGGYFYRDNASLIDGTITLTDGDFVVIGYLIAEE